MLICDRGRGEKARERERREIIKRYFVYRKINSIYLIRNRVKKIIKASLISVMHTNFSVKPK